MKHVLQLTVVHHVIHGRLHLQEHPLLLPLRDASETHSWKRDSLHLVLLLWTTFLQKNVVVQVLKSTSQKLELIRKTDMVYMDIATHRLGTSRQMNTS